MCCSHEDGTSRGRRRARGFSLVEIMVVIIIIGLLAGAVALKVSGYVDRARLDRARSDIATIVTAVETYYADQGQYPSNDQGLSVLPLKSITDPWGRPYIYNQPGRTEPFEVICFGADGREGGDGPDTDVLSWQLGTSRSAENGR
ncbi:MAG: type II secretion system protein GspG [Phycisphaerae bacterium]|nr:type II secretion system protein GspG [Phycisphaerae bacterium]